MKHVTAHVEQTNDDMHAQTNTFANTTRTRTHEHANNMLKLIANVPKHYKLWTPITREGPFCSNRYTF